MMKGVNLTILLAIWECGGCEAVFYSLSITQYCSHSYGVLSGLLQTSQVVHCLTTTNVTDVIRVSETLVLFLFDWCFCAWLPPSLYLRDPRASLGDCEDRSRSRPLRRKWSGASPRPPLRGPHPLLFTSIRIFNRSSLMKRHDSNDGASTCVCASVLVS